MKKIVVAVLTLAMLCMIVTIVCVGCGKTPDTPVTPTDPITPNPDESTLPVDPTPGGEVITPDDPVDPTPGGEIIDPVDPNPGEIITPVDPVVSDADIENFDAMLESAYGSIESYEIIDGDFF